VSFLHRDENTRKQAGNQLLSPHNAVRDLPLQELVRQRFKTLVDTREVSHETLAKYLGLSRSGVTRLLNDEGSGFGLHHIERLCEFFQVTPVEILADAATVIQPVTPIESSLLQHFRQMTELERRSLLTILERPIFTQAPHAKKSRLGRAMLTVKEQELVDLYARVKKDGVREGVLKTLRGAAEADDVRVPVKPRTTG
jgi:DNA-binding Xre family transcriptional regulator